MKEFKRHDLGIDLQKVVDALFGIIKSLDSDDETRKWARDQLTEIMKVTFIPVFYVEDTHGVMK